MRRLIRHSLALALGVGAALLVACGASTKGAIPSASAGDLKSQIEDVQQAVDGGRCDEVSGQLRQVDDGIDELPATVDERLRQALRDAADRLRTSAVAECSEPEETQTEPEPARTQTETAPPEIRTAPPETATAPPETTTTPPETTPDPVPPAEPAPPVVAPPPPPQGTPGGGARPETGDGNGQAPG